MVSLNFDDLGFPVVELGISPFSPLWSLFWLILAEICHVSMAYPSGISGFELPSLKRVFPVPWLSIAYVVPPLRAKEGAKRRVVRGRRLIENYSKSSDKGREYIDRVAEQEAKYVIDKK